MRVMNHNWSAMKPRLHLQSVAKISRHSVLSGTGFDNVRHRLGLATRKDADQCKSPFPSAGTTVSLFQTKKVQQIHNTEPVQQVVEGGRNPVAGLWGHTLGEN